MKYKFMFFFQTVKNKTETVTEEMLDEDLKEDELSDNEEQPSVPDVEQEESQPANVSNKSVLYLLNYTLILKTITFAWIFI